MIYSDKFNEIFKYTMILHTPYGSSIGSLNKKINDLKYSGTFLGTDEISFTVPYYLTNTKTGKREKNPIYDEIKGDYLVLVTNPFFTDEQGKMFVVKDCTEETTDKGYIFKSCLLYTLENKLNDKTITDFEGDSRLIYDPENKRDDDGIEIGFLNHIFNKTSWTLGTISPEYQEKHRALRINNSTMLKALNDVAKTFDCVFVFDTINKTISVKNLSEIGSNKDGYISDRNFIKNLKKTINSSEVKTRLYLYGKDNISIQKINPLGQPYIDNLSFFMNEDYMPTDLIQALKNYRQFVESKKPLFEESIAEYNKINTEIDKIEEELLKAEIELKKRMHEQDLSMIAPDKYPDAKKKVEEQEGVVKAIKDRIDAELEKIEIEIQKIDALREEMKIDKHFTSEQLSIIDDFIKEDTYTNSDYAEENLQELYDFGIKTLERVSTPAIDFDIDIVDFFSLLEYQTEWHKFRLGDIVRVKNDELEFNYLVRLVGIEHDPDNNNLVLRFTNKDNLNDKSLYLEDVLNNMNTSIASVDWNKFDWDKGKDADENLRKYLDNALDLAKQQIVNGRNQKPLLDERGFWLYKESDAGDISPEQIRMVNNVIALTKDNWETVDIAISPTLGINANLIRGDIIEGVTIKAGTLTGLMSDTVKIDGSLITSGTIEGVTVKADTLTGRMSDKVTIDGSLISTGTIEGVKLKGNEIEGAIINGTEINGGTIEGANIIGSKISAGQITVSNDFADTDLGKNIYNEFGQISNKIDTEIDKVKKSVGIPLGENKTMYELLTEQESELKGLISNKRNVHTGSGRPTLSNEPAVNWIDKASHLTDVYIDTDNGKMYEFKNDSSGYSWVEITNQDIKDIINNQQEIENRLKNLVDNQVGVYWGDETPTRQNPPANSWTDSELSVHVGDLYINRANGKMYEFRYKSKYDWFEVENKGLTDVLNEQKNLNKKIDNSIVIHRGDGVPTLENKPAVNWDDADKGSHVGDLYIDKKTLNMYEFIETKGVYSWKPLEDSSLKDEIAKREEEISILNDKIKNIVDKQFEIHWGEKVPTISNHPANKWLASEYQKHIGDLYIDRTTSKLYEFQYSSTGYEWVEADNPQLTDILNEQKNLNTKIDNSIVVHRGDGVPSEYKEPESNWTTGAIKEKHVGDIYIDKKTLEMYEYQEVNSQYSWAKLENKKLIDEIKKREEEITRLEDIIDDNIVVHTGNKVPTISNPPANSWTTTALKSKHENDIYIDTSTGINYRWTGLSWVKVDSKEIKDALANIDLSGVSQIFLQKSEPTSNDKPNKGDLWILPSGATFTYDDTISNPYRWQLTSPNLEELAISVFPEIRDKAKSLGISSYIVVSASSSGIKIDWTNMTATMNSFDMPELWVVLYKGYRNFTRNDKVRFYHDKTSSQTANSENIGYYNKTIGELGVLTKNASGAYEWRKVKDKVETGKSYNNVIITPEKGVVVQDEQGKDKLIMGGWPNLKWGDFVDYGFRYNYTDDYNNKVLYLGKNGLTMYYPDSNDEVFFMPQVNPIFVNYQYDDYNDYETDIWLDTSTFSLPKKLYKRYVLVVVSTLSSRLTWKNLPYGEVPSTSLINWMTNCKHQDDLGGFSEVPNRYIYIDNSMPLIMLRPQANRNNVKSLHYNIRIDFFILG